MNTPFNDKGYDSLLSGVPATAPRWWLMSWSSRLHTSFCIGSPVCWMCHPL